MSIRLRHLRSVLLAIFIECLSSAPLPSAPPVPSSNQIIKIDWKEQGKAVNGSWEARYKNIFRLSSMWTGTIGGGFSLGGKTIMVGAGMSSPVGLYKVRGSLLGLKPGDMLQYYLSESVGTGTETVGSPPTSISMKEGLSRDGMFTLSIGDKTFMEGDLKFRKDQGVPANENFPDIGRAYSRAIDLKRTANGVEVLLGTSNFTLPYSPHGPNFPADDCSQAEGTQEKVFQDLKSFKFTNAELQNPGQLTKSRMSSNSVEGDTYTASVTVTIMEEEDDTEVSVEPQQGYFDWLPKGNLQNPSQPGNTFKVSIKVHKKDDPGKPRRANLKFSLAKVSKEKGVCMNWPEGAPEGEGLRFRPEDYGEGSKISVQDIRHASTTEAVEEAELVLSCFDYGAWATLRIMAKDEQGHEAKVKVRGKETEDLDIPKDDNQNHIADAWEQANGVSGYAADSDNENDPVGKGFSFRGDGLTLYEEYRGFRVQDSHECGDPKKKDVFVCDDTGGHIAVSGINLFEQATGLKVHSLRKEELGSLRIINKNGSGDTHSVDQHGILIVDGKAGTDPYTAPATPSGDYGPPAMTKEIQIPKGKNCDSGDGLADVAHELCHAVGVDHHGEKNLLSVFWTWKRDPGGQWQLYEQGLNVAEKGKLSWLEGLKPITIYFENPLKEYRHGDALPAHFTWDEVQQGWILWLGGKGSVFSGDQECLQRYYDKQAYQSDMEPSRVRYIPDEGQWKMRNRLCESSRGTGVNEPDHAPQSRYGDASMGNCKGQIVVNDKYAKQ